MEATETKFLLRHLGLTFVLYYTTYAYMIGKSAWKNRFYRSRICIIKTLTTNLSAPDKGLD